MPKASRRCAKALAALREHGRRSDRTCSLTFLAEAPASRRSSTDGAWRLRSKDWPAGIPPGTIQEAELYRLKGELLLPKVASSDAEAEDSLPPRD